MLTPWPTHATLKSNPKRSNKNGLIYATFSAEMKTLFEEALQRSIGSKIENGAACGTFLAPVTPNTIGANEAW